LGISPVGLRLARSPGRLAGGTSAGEISWRSRGWEFFRRDLLEISLVGLLRDPLEILPVELLPARSPGDLAGGTSAGEISGAGFCRGDLLGISPALRISGYLMAASGG